jgi:hypothetical protein
MRRKKMKYTVDDLAQDIADEIAAKECIDDVTIDAVKRFAYKNGLSITTEEAIAAVADAEVIFGEKITLD